MFILTGSLKGKAVTAGVVIACLVLVAFVLRVAWCQGGYTYICPFVGVLIVGAIYKGWDAGYYVARFIFGMLPILIVGGTINPFAYLDVSAAEGSYSLFVLETLPWAAMAAGLFYCLGEHAGLRDSSPERETKGRRRRRTNFLVAGLTLFFFITGIFLVGSAWLMIRQHVASRPVVIENPNK